MGCWYSIKPYFNEECSGTSHYEVQGDQRQPRPLEAFPVLKGLNNMHSIQVLLVVCFAVVLPQNQDLYHKF